MIKADVLKRMRRVLRRLGYVSEDGVVTQKGRCACELAGADELIATELIFNGTFKAAVTHARRYGFVSRLERKNGRQRR